MATIQPSRDFEGSRLDHAEIVQYEVDSIAWDKLSKEMKRNEAMRIIREARDKGIKKTVAIPIVKAAIESTGTRYKDKFYEGVYSGALPHYRR